MRETIFTDRVVAGLKNWQIMARKSISFKESNTGSTTPTLSRSQSVSTHSLQPSMSSPRAAGTSLWCHGPFSSFIPSPSFISSPAAAAASTSSVPRTQSPLNRSLRSGADKAQRLSSSPSAQTWKLGTRRFEFPTRRRELEEIQKVTEEMMGTSGRRAGFEGGEMSFRIWWKQEMISSIGGRRTSWCFDLLKVRTWNMFYGYTNRKIVFFFNTK